MRAGRNFRIANTRSLRHTVALHEFARPQRPPSAGPLPSRGARRARDALPGVARALMDGIVLRKRRILLVEDNEDARETMRILLRMAGHHVESSGDGAEGLEKALAQRPDVAILDIGLPGFDGYEIARRIRAACDGSYRPYLVALTGYGLAEDRRRAFDAGFDAHLVKPVDQALLERTLADASKHASRMAPEVDA
jgi:CheY-like chemotaxis protein